MRNLLHDTALAVVLAQEKVRDSINGGGHPGADHDAWLREPRDPNAAVHIYDTVGDCAACGGSQYGAEYELNIAFGDLREALGMERRAWEER